ESTKMNAAWNANSVAVPGGFARVIRTSHGATLATAPTPATAAAQGCRAPHAIRSPAGSRVCRLDARRSSIGTARGTDAILGGHEDLAGPARAFRPAVLYGCRGPPLARTKPGESLAVGEAGERRPRSRLGVREARRRVYRAHSDRWSDLQHVGSDREVLAACKA